MSTFYEKLIVTGFVGFAVAFGLSNYDAGGFLSGFFAGSAATICYFLWKEDDDDNL